VRSEAIIPTTAADPGAANAPGAARIAGALAMIAALALLAAVVAYWAWQVFAPRSVHVPASAPADPLAALRVSGLFAGGDAPSANGPAAAPQGLPGDARLLGVFAEANGRGYALFRMPNGPRLVAAGAEIASGATLVDVKPDSIGIRESGGERRIELRIQAPRPNAGSAASPVAPATKTAAAAPRNTCGPPAGFKGDVVALNAELMGGLIAQPESWRALVEPSNGGLVVRDESGFAAMLGLKRGDRIAQANGIALSAPDDIVGAVLRPLAARQTVRVTGSRDGQPREVWLRNATC